jgi:hypothetical protein
MPAAVDHGVAGLDNVFGVIASPGIHTSVVNPPHGPSG